ncbi:MULTISPECIES: polysaccharide deacetylase family protein [Bradyrhizobium]|uniref:polysaccharide deacetylase family protein n=1 Tax=Bradyrhizobium TaxID=374 RepID=UPI0004B9DE81|nr:MULTISPECIES: polysaccharide deacetylase family protein [Bradyrhizobium]MCA1429710.1 polysaccharide deacetylase family protein [Bradyrhizobium sp. NBAIM16]MCA1471483.1 polysaccharide deacetylase family protein [Bradyrhizobium sp. IC3195]MCA1507366.1 polysaccharide deacetylase family protein [Bradyrhizobium sp. NBAIM02]MCA1514800.1 polysaccharide deacetylase family protein [Bradyrhizobium sp. NBAIM01]UWU84506.1 polysaccharide deacetylase family protein [Bradyrhizobium sp. CB1024]
MRNALGLMLASVVAAVVIAAGGWFYYSARADQGAPKTVAARAADPLPAQAKLAAKDDVETTAAVAAKPAAAAPAPAPVPVMPMQPKQACANPNALGVSRVVEIDTTGGPGFGFEHFKQFDFLTEKEVVLTFDDGPWPVNTPTVLKALADECTKGLFFSVGKHATYHPEILKQVLAQGHTVGTHTWSHVNLNSKKLTEQQVKDEVEKGFSAVKFALGTNPAPFFRFPQLQHNPAMVSYFGTRNVAMFSTEIDSFDFRKGATPEKIVETVMTRLDKLGKGIILMHDFQKNTGLALPTLLARLKAGGYKVVQMKAKTSLQTLPEYDEALMKDMKVPTAGTNSRPIASVVQTISQ